MESRLASGRVDNTFLARKNAHERDSRIVFDEEPHLYYIDGSTEGYVSVTTYVHSHFESFDADRIIANMMKSKNWESNEKYYGKTPEQIKKEWQDNCNKAAADGTRMHFVIESYYNEKFNPESPYKCKLPSFYLEKEGGEAGEEEEEEEEEEDKTKVGSTSIEFEYFTTFVRDHKSLVPYRTEWTIFDEELKLAGSIDMLFYDSASGNFHIYDWKRCRNIQKTNGFNKWGNKECIEHLPDTNFWHYSLQLNVYKALLERKYNMTIDGLYLVCLHPNNKNKNYIKLKAPDLQEEVNCLFALRLLDLDITI